MLKTFAFCVFFLTLDPANSGVSESANPTLLNQRKSCYNCASFLNCLSCRPRILVGFVVSTWNAQDEGPGVNKNIMYSNNNDNSKNNNTLPEITTVQKWKTTCL